MYAHRSDRSGHRFFKIAAACVLGITVFAASTGTASAQQSSAALVPVGGAMFPVGDLEKAFWVCDHTATVSGVDAAPVALCSAVFEALRDHKFGGDFGELLAWWQENKPIEHAKLGSTR